MGMYVEKRIVLERPHKRAVFVMRQDPKFLLGVVASDQVVTGRRSDIVAESDEVYAVLRQIVLKR